jgi:release factor glutamine methyltransferase
MDTIRLAIRDGQRVLEEQGIPSARLDAELLLAFVLGIERGRLPARYPEQLAAADRSRYLALLRRRAEERVPVQHLTGVQEFYSLPFHVDNRVLIPRPETELLVDELLEFARVEHAAGRRVSLMADVGTGSGCIAIAAAANCPRLRCLATDISPDALEVASVNVKRHGLEDRIGLVAGDLLTPVADGGGLFDAVVCNPPYVSERELEGLQEEVRRHEAHDALVSGPTGLEAYRRLLPRAAECLREGGLLAVELAIGRHEAVRELADSGPWRDVTFREDFQGIDRILSARRERRPGQR